MLTSRDKIESMLWKYAINIGTAIFAAAIAPAVAFSLIGLHLGGISFVFLIALAHAVVLGLPIYLISSRKRKLTWFISTFAGFVIGSIPAAILLFPYTPNRNRNAYSNGEATIIDGIPTLYGWFEYATVIFLYFGLHGAIGGFTFWLILKSLSKPNSTNKQYFSYVSLQVILPLVVATIAIAILMSQVITDLIYS